MRLSFLYMPGCPACEKAKPQLNRFEKANPGITVVRVNLLEAKWTDPWSPTATPTYVFEVPGRQRTRWEGMLSATEIGQFINKSKQMMGIR